MSFLRYTLVALAAIVGVHYSRATVECARLFTDHLVFQRDRPVPVWGQADPRETVVVEFAGQRHETLADEAGHWRVTLTPLAASFDAQALIVRGAANSLTFSDVLVGEVWFCSGQSNMEKPVGPMSRQRPTAGYELDFLEANRPALRLFQVPRTDLKQDGPAHFRWLPTTSHALSESRFSAAAYHFGRVLQSVLGVPVGLIHASFGGTRIEAWMPQEAFATPALDGLERQTYPAWVKGVQPTELFASMVRPYAPYAIRGFIWYQGETNCMAADVELYAAKQIAMIEAWRRAWEAPDAPFFGVLLAPFVYSTWQKIEADRDALPAFWQAQQKALSSSSTGYAVIHDLVDDLHDIHPVEKRGVGERLARLALAQTYGIPGVSSRGPELEGWRRDIASIELQFSHVEKLRTRDGLPSRDFAVAGENQIFHPAEATIDGPRVTLRSTSVPAPIAVRFGWSETSRPTLINEAGLPAAPFRTDDWPLQTQRPTTKPKSAGQGN